MKTSVIKTMINKAINNEKSTNGLAQLVIQVAGQNGKNMTIQEAKGVSNLVIEYVQLVPQFLEEGMNKSHQFGLSNEIGHMMKELEYYWMLEDDIIPDNLGLIGITDDAYASMFLLQSLSDYCRQTSGRPLISTDLTNMNKLIRNILGQPVASAIEQKVQVTIGNNMLNQMINQMYQNIFSSGFTFNAMNSYLEQRQIEDQVNVQMGAMGIV